MKERNLDAWQISAGFILALCLGLYIGVPSIQKFVDGTWQAVSGKVRTTWTDFEKVSLPPAEEMDALKGVHLKKACGKGNAEACRHLEKSNELKGLLLLDRTKACEQGDKTACEEIGQPVPKASKCPPGVTACAAYEKYEAKWKKKSS